MTDINKAITGMLETVLKEKQNAPNQYVVAYKRKSDDSLIGYHLSTACQKTTDIFEAKRYSGDKPDKQLEIIWNNFKHVMSKTEENTVKEGLFGLFDEMAYRVKLAHWEGFTVDEVYIDAVYLAEGTPKQNFQIKIIENGTENNQGESTGSSQ